MPSTTWPRPGTPTPRSASGPPTPRGWTGRRKYINPDTPNETRPGPGTNRAPAAWALGRRVRGDADVDGDPALAAVRAGRRDPVVAGGGELHREVGLAAGPRDRARGAGRGGHPGGPGHGAGPP